MRVTDIINNAKSTLFSIEILPPLKGKDINSVFNGIDPLMEFKPAFIDVTYHREEYVLRKRSDGGFDKVYTRKRPGTVAICAALMNKYKIDTVPHLICGGFSKEETENALIELNFLGVDNVLVLRGDNIKNEPNFTPEPDGNKTSLELLHQVKNMNNGIYLDPDLENASQSNFCISVSGYPEKHYEAPNMSSDLKWLKAKVDAGAEYIVTQMFFNNEKFLDFVKTVRDMGITVPIIPGLKPLTTKKQMSILPKVFHIDLPEALTNEVEKCKDDKAVKQVGIEWAIQQSKELKAAGTPVLHYYTMGLAETTKAIASKVF
ncbi:MAG: methylenetetrahydrofolate reductase [NAD(P)H] [Bacteroidota bacterium]